MAQQPSSPAARVGPRLYQIRDRRGNVLSLDGLTNQPLPTGWGDSREPSPVNPSDGEEKTPLRREVKLGPPRRGRTWRFAKTVFNLLRRPEVVRDLPVHLQLESTDACNLHCTSCSRDMLVDKAKLLTEAQWKKIIDELQPTNINVSGIGEPFLHPDILRIVRYARSKGSKVNCATNFTRVRGRHREIVEAGFSQLKVSIDSATPDTYRKIRGEDFFGTIIDNVKEVQRWKAELGSATPSVRFNFALQHLNFQEAADLVDLAAKVGVDGIYFQYLSYVDMEDRKDMLTADMTEQGLRDVLTEAERRAKEHGVNTNLNIWWRDWDILWNAMQPISEFRPNEKSCYFPWMSTWLGADGWIRPCPIMPWTHDEGRMGHIDDSSFEEIWNNEKYRELRRALARGERPTRSCKLCYPQDLYNIFLLKTKLLP